EAQFCRPGKQGAHEKGGVEGEGGYFRRNHFVPIPKAEDFADLNRQLFASCQQDQHRQIGERQQSVGAGMLIEQQYLLPLASDGFELTETSFPIVDAKGRVKVRNNWYSVPLRAGIKVMARTLPTYIELWYEGNLVARHER